MRKRLWWESDDGKLWTADDGAKVERWTDSLSVMRCWHAYPPGEDKRPDSCPLMLKGHRVSPRAWQSAYTAMDAIDRECPHA